MTPTIVTQGVSADAEDSANDADDTEVTGFVSRTCERSSDRNGMAADGRNGCDAAAAKGTTGVVGGIGERGKDDETLVFGTA